MDASERKVAAGSSKGGHGKGAAGRRRGWSDDTMERREQQDWSVLWINCCSESLVLQPRVT